MDRFTPNFNLTKLIESGSPLHSPFFKKNAKELFNNTISDSVELYLKRNNHTSVIPILYPEVISLMNSISEIEKKHKDELEQLSINIVRDLYKIPDKINFKVSLNNTLNLDTAEKNDLEENKEEIQELSEHIYKRELLTALVHGSSVHFWKSAYHLASKQLNLINYNLLPLYNKLTSTVNLTFFQMSPLIIDSSIKNNSKITQGYNKVEIKENKAQIYCYGINFPTLLHEINKAVMEYIIAYGLPNELSDKQINIVYNKADDYKNEFYHYILSPTIWKELLSIANIENEQIPILIMKLSLLEYKALDELFDDIINNKPNAKEKLKKLC